MVSYKNRRRYTQVCWLLLLNTILLPRVWQYFHVGEGDYCLLFFCTFVFSEFKLIILQIREPVVKVVSTGY